MLTLRLARARRSVVASVSSVVVVVIEIVVVVARMLVVAMPCRSHSLRPRLIVRRALSVRNVLVIMNVDVALVVVVMAMTDVIEQPMVSRRIKRVTITRNKQCVV
jgi:hypothetical protein